MNEILNALNREIAVTLKAITNSKSTSCPGDIDAHDDGHRNLVDRLAVLRDVRYRVEALI